MPELTLAIKKPNGLLLVDGCSHSGIEELLQSASAVDSRTYMVFGGLHLLATPEAEIDQLVANLKTKWKLQRIAPGHCTGEPAFARLQKAFGEIICMQGRERLSRWDDFGILATAGMESTERKGRQDGIELHMNLCLLRETPGLDQPF